MGSRGLVVATVGGALLATAALAQQQTAAAPSTPQQAAAESGPVKIGFVDVQRVVFSIDEGKARLKALQDWAKPKRDEMQRLANEVQSLQDELSAKQGVESDDALAALNKRFVTKRRALEDAQRDAKLDLQQKQDAIFKDLNEKLNKVLLQYGEANHFTAIFTLQPNSVAYLAKAADVTDQVVKLYNQTYPYQQEAAATGK